MSVVFVYGTLLAPEILSIVLGRNVRREDYRPATAKCFRRYALPDRPYPVMRSSAADETTGAVITTITDEELKRLDHFEATLYKRQLIDVITTNGNMQAFAYVDPGTDTLSANEWSREAFERDYLHAYIERKTG